jgi:ABC-type multidrug transport system ATPase subunit
VHRAAMTSLTTTTAAPTPVVELLDVSRRWRPGILGVAPEVDALRRVTLQLFPGELVVLAGAAGAGKSALLLLATGEVAPTSGVVRWADRDEPSAVRPQRIGARPWEYAFLSVRQAIAFHAGQLLLQDARLHPPTRFLPLLRRVGLHGRSRTRLGELSALDAFRVVVAQGLLARPSLLCCDEPFAFCGPTERAQALQLLRRVAGAGIAVLIATRDAEAIASLDGIDRIVRLRAGRIVRDRPTSGPRPLVPPPSLTGTPARRRVRRITTLARGAEPTIPRVAEERPPV